MSSTLRPALLAAGLTTGAVLLIPNVAHADEVKSQPEDSSTVAECPPGQLAKATEAAKQAEGTAAKSEMTAKATLVEAQGAAKDAAAKAENAQQATDAAKTAEQVANEAQHAAGKLTEASLAEATKDQQQASQKLAEAKLDATQAAKATQTAKSEQNTAQAGVDAARAEKAQVEQVKTEADQAVGTATIEHDAAVSAHAAILRDGNQAQEKAKKAVTAAAADSAVKETAVTQTQQALDQATTAVDSAQQLVDTATTKATASNAAATKAKTEQMTAAQAASQAQADLNAALALVATKTKELEAAKAGLQEQRKGGVTAEQIAAAEAQVAQAQAALEQAKKSAKPAQDLYAEGSFGFFKKLGAQAAVDVLNDTESKDPSGKTIASYTHKGDPQDATSLENLQATVALLKKSVELRTKEYLEAGMTEAEAKAAAERKISPYYTAVAQRHANWSAHYRGHAGDNGDKYEAGENAAWNNTRKEDPFLGWYHQEKAIWDEQVKQGAVKASERFDAYAFYLAHPELYPHFGHYLNLVDKGKTATGYAITSRRGSAETGFESAPPISYPLTHVQEFAASAKNGEKLYTLEEYERLVNTYCSKVTQAKHAGDQIVAAAQTKLDAANQELAQKRAGAADGAAPGQNAQHAAQAELDAAKAKAAKATADKTTKDAILAKADAALKKAQQVADVDATDLTAKKQDLTDKKATQSQARSTLAQAKAALTKAQAAEVAARQALAALGDGMSLEEAQQRVDKAKTKLQAANQAETAAEARLASASTTLTTAEQKLAQATGKLRAATAAETTAKQAVTTAQSTLERATARVGQIRDLLTGRGDGRAAATAAQQQAARAQAALQSARQRLVAATGSKSFGTVDAAALVQAAKDLEAINHAEAMKAGVTDPRFPLLTKAYAKAKADAQVAAKARAQAGAAAKCDPNQQVQESPKPCQPQSGPEEQPEAGTAAQPELPAPEQTHVVTNKDGQVFVAPQAPYAPKHQAPAAQAPGLAATGAGAQVLLPLAGGMVLAGAAVRRRRQA
ncbi:chromosome segregation protein SMC [Actinomyces bovis]|uniref:Chromosome segregation protein SMC n=1 Tax=Actinomyces bovis TaxID=1658 RepID=A0ABY1VQP2_9ACTO|nr:hypothetical protein [Actinomyces bovis]SPT54370.1 chromosome segregation protein SMC [Actinomyces bovis]VEG56095.1 chromosome segregation protein SMC [Actinomyces israelii]